jgi:arabinan endo-1,5-alpha-L-arabinosidase
VLETDGDFVGPGHASIIREGNKYLMCMHFYDKTRNGANTLAIRPFTWDALGWPEQSLLNKGG